LLKADYLQTPIPSGARVLLTEMGCPRYAPNFRRRADTHYHREVKLKRAG